MTSKLTIKWPLNLPQKSKNLYNLDILIFLTSLFSPKFVKKSAHKKGPKSIKKCSQHDFWWFLIFLSFSYKIIKIDVLKQLNMSTGSAKSQFFAFSVLFTLHLKASKMTSKMSPKAHQGPPQGSQKELQHDLKMLSQAVPGHIPKKSINSWEYWLFAFLTSPFWPKFASKKVHTEGSASIKKWSQHCFFCMIYFFAKSSKKTHLRLQFSSNSLG